MNSLEKIKIEVGLVLAKVDDFSYYILDKKHRKIGMQYFLKNSNGDIECYSLHQNTDARELKQFIDEKRCFIYETQRIGEKEMIKKVTN